MTVKCMRRMRLYLRERSWAAFSTEAYLWIWRGLLRVRHRFADALGSGIVLGFQNYSSLGFRWRIEKNEKEQKITAEQLDLDVFS